MVAGVILRLIPHTANFAPIGAIAFFGGAVLPLRYAWWLPAAIMVVSDLVIGLHDTIAFTWLGFTLVGLLGVLFQGVNKWWRAPVGAIAGAIIFYVVSNFGVWMVGNMYPHTLPGLIDCYVAAIPFFRTSLTADLLYSIILFSAFALAVRPSAILTSNEHTPLK